MLVATPQYLPPRLTSFIHLKITLIAAYSLCSRSHSCWQGDTPFARQEIIRKNVASFLFEPVAGFGG